MTEKSVNDYKEETCRRKEERTILISTYSPGNYCGIKGCAPDTMPSVLYAARAYSHMHKYSGALHYVARDALSNDFIYRVMRI